MDSPMIFVSEITGTTVMIFLGLAVTIVTGARRLSPVAGAAGWAAAVFLGASLSDSSGAHMNPAITLAQVLSGRSDLALVPAYLGAQFAGAVLGALLASVVFWPTIRANEHKTTTLGWFATTSRDTAVWRSILTECLATTVLVMWVLNPPQPVVEDGVYNFGNSGLGYAGIAIVIFVLSLGAGSPTGAALNPVRDLGPRIVYTVLLRSHGPANWSYAVVPVVGPTAGALLAVAVSSALPINS